MKVVLILACLALFVACSEGQRRCRGAVAPASQNCVGGRNSGRGSRRGNCRRNLNWRMWYFDANSRTCRRMFYRGCGGNNNRYCSLAECQQRCAAAATTAAAPAGESSTAAAPAGEAPASAAPAGEAPAAEAPPAA